MIQVPLNLGRVALIDEQDAECVLSRSWFANPAPGGRFYAMRQEGGRTIYMHRTILCAPAHLDVDHANGDGLDNRRSNIRLATRSQNGANRDAPGSSGGFRGVYRERGRYRARIWVNDRAKHLGCFDDPVDAALAYDAAASFYFGDFARLNIAGRRQ